MSVWAKEKESHLYIQGCPAWPGGNLLPWSQLRAAGSRTPHWHPLGSAEVSDRGKAGGKKGLKLNFVCQKLPLGLERFTLSVQKNNRVVQVNGKERKSFLEIYFSLNASKQILFTYLSFLYSPFLWIWFSRVKLKVKWDTSSSSKIFTRDSYASSWK